MRSVYAYGCSYTHGYQDEIGKGWVTRLKLKEEVNLYNRGHAGAGWVTVRNKILKEAHKFNIGDIIIVQIPFPYRVEVPYFIPKYDSFMRFWNEHPEGTTEWLKYVLPEHQLEAVISEEALDLFNTLTRLGTQVVWWQTENMYTLMNSDYPMLTIGDYPCFFDWNHSRYDLTISGDGKDTHLNEKGYFAMATDFGSQLNRIINFKSAI